MSLDSSIPSHLRCPRTRTRRVSDTWKPAVPAYSALGPQSIKQLVMAYFGVQIKSDETKGQACAAFRTILQSFNVDDGPARHDLVQFVDGQGHLNLIAVAYWEEPEKYHKWNDKPAVKSWWSSDDRLNDGVGYFREIFSPRMEQFETIFTAPGPLEGVSILLGGLTEPIIEHGYWGSMRDRLPLSQTDTMDPSGELALKQGTPAKGGRVIVAGHQNLTLIRSGEDWSRTDGEERRTWFEDIQPVLLDGMNYLRDDGLEVGCYCNRYCYHMDKDGKVEEKGFGVSLWRSLSNLESWAESHPTHLQIFVTFNRLAKKFKELVLYHEVSVFDASAQYFEYINCHPKTGVMRAFAA
ncbi:aldoxime dehydratase [Methylovirgula ligni]|uniref:Aldoxime dehydratase n=1 Tax=Methylovirgula ligni TaxID=569860 RepID=A0A3D9YTK7_9HYPH|nr:phenylacetaldoxime dehydratase family protein [Methylovirgula ligni]REF85936.1 aldoxime dehydratase [Methylovirgula ligni]